MNLKVYNIERNFETNQSRINQIKAVSCGIGWKRAAEVMLSCGVHKTMQIPFKLSKKKRIRIKQFSNLLRGIAFQEALDAHRKILEDFKKLHEIVLEETNALTPNQNEKSAV